LPNLAAAGLQAGFVTAATAAGFATGGVVLPLVVASGLIAAHLGLRIAGKQVEKKDGAKVQAALNVLRKRAVAQADSIDEVSQELNVLGFDLSLDMDETLKRLAELDGLVRQQGKSDDEMLGYLRTNQGLMVSMGLFLQQSFEELRGEIRSLPAGVEELNASVVALCGQAGVKIDQLHTKVDVLTDGQDKTHAELAIIRKYLEDMKRPGVDPTKEHVPPDVIAAARELMSSRDGRERAQAAIVLKKWEDWRREVAALNAARAVDEVFQNKTVEGDGYYAQGLFDEAIRPYEVAFRLRENDIAARTNLAIALIEARRGSQTDRQRRAIELAEGTLEIPAISRLDWAMTQNNLGNALAKIPSGDRTQNLHGAITAFEAALQVHTRDAFPVKWAMIQNNLGNAWVHMPTGDRAGNLSKAIAAFESALTVFTRVDAPIDWALTQSNLGTAMRAMPLGDQADNLERAIAAYREALTVISREEFPFDWAMTQNNLGNALAIMPRGDKAENVRSAIEAYEAALTVRTREAAPVEWAATQNNLGSAWRSNPTGDKDQNMRNAVAAYEAALLVRTREADPFAWAATQNNLGNAWLSMPTRNDSLSLENAIAAYTAALTVYTRDAAPFEWAGTLHNLAMALSNQAELSNASSGDRSEQLRRAIAAGKGALIVRTRESMPHHHAKTSHNLAIDRRRYEELGGHLGPDGVAFDDIPPAQ